jgi:hypothetical protein
VSALARIGHDITFDVSAAAVRCGARARCARAARRAQPPQPPATHTTSLPAPSRRSLRCAR